MDLMIVDVVGLIFRMSAYFNEKGISVNVQIKLGDLSSARL
jgi:hypothetical protein